MRTMRSLRLIISVLVIILLLFCFRANGEGVVDLSHFASSFGEFTSALPADLNRFDRDNDGDVDGIDLAYYSSWLNYAPLATLSVNPQIIRIGESSTLEWHTSYAYNVSVAPGIGDVTPEGSLQIFPVETTSYTITLEGPGGTTSQTVTLYVVSPDDTCSENVGDFRFDIEYPPDGLVIPLHDGPSITVTGSFPSLDECYEKEVMLDGQATIIDGNRFTGNITLYPGNNQIIVDATISGTECCMECISECMDNCTDDDCEIACEDRCDDKCQPEIISTSKVCVVYGQSDVFDVVINDPVDGEIIHYPDITINGYVSDHMSSVTLNGVPADLDEEGYFNATIHLAEGTNVVTATATRGEESVSDTVTIIYHPLLHIEIVEPDGKYDLANDVYVIRWSDIDTDDNAIISLFYDTDEGGEDGILIASGLPEDPDGDADEYLWDTAEIPEGTYYIYAVIDDGKHDPVVSYSEGPVVVNHREFYFRGNSSTASNFFGSSVDISGNYAIVGDYGDSEAGEFSGAAYIFQFENSGWKLQMRLVPSDLKPGDYFGHSVAISGDYAIVGAYGDDDGGEDSGAAYIFKREGSQWIEQKKIKASVPGKLVRFGYCVDIDGNYAIISAYGEITGYYFGTAYVFVREGSEWVEQDKLIATDAQSIYDWFGRSVSMQGQRAVVGSEGDDVGTNNTGSLYIFERNDFSWTEKVKIVASDASSQDKLGNSVSIGSNCAIGGAPGKDYGADSSGAAYIIGQNGSDWEEKAKLCPSDPSANQFFGCSVGISGAYAIVGASVDDDQ